MRAFALTICLRDKPGVISRYESLHRDVWPGVVARMHQVGIESMRIWRSGNRLFMHVEAVDGFEPDRDFRAIDEDPLSRRWNDVMRELQERAPEAQDGVWWAPMELVFDTAWSAQPSDVGR